MKMFSYFLVLNTPPIKLYALKENKVKKVNNFIIMTEYDLLFFYLSDKFRRCIGSIRRSQATKREIDNCGRERQQPELGARIHIVGCFNNVLILYIF
jgi:hypothetical protein